jgi:ketopantoate hydroxymethyltransferase
MTGALAEAWKSKKQKKQKIFATSYIGSAFDNLICDRPCDFVRFDIREAALVYGYGDERSITETECNVMLRHISNDGRLFVSDIPYSMECDNNALSLIGQFMGRYHIGAVNLRLNHNILPLAKKLVLSGVPVIITADSDSLICSEERIVENAVEAGNTCAVLMITEGLSDESYEKIKSMCKIPVIADRNIKNADGYYARYSEIIGMTESKNQYLNIRQLIGSAFDDAAESMNVK